jgi:uncharacterized protein with HXXEE motif
MAPLLFPLTFALHLLEECAAGEWFGAWSARVLGAPMNLRTFLIWNALAFVLMCIGSALVMRVPRLRWIEAAMSIAVLGNAAFHLVASALTRTWSPGLATAILLWLPLGAARLPVAIRESSPRGRRIGILVGVSAVIVSLAVMAAG